MDDNFGQEYLDDCNDWQSHYEGSNIDKNTIEENVRMRFAEYGKIVTNKQVNTIVEMIKHYLGLNERD